MDVAGHIAVMNAGRIEQVGTPREVYESPATEFVLRFLGPVAQFQGRLVRPHDLRVLRHAEPGAIAATVSRVSHLGFEVRIELTVPDAPAVTAQLTRGEARHLDVRPGDEVWVSASDVRAPIRAVV